MSLQAQHLDSRAKVKKNSGEPGLHSETYKNIKNNNEGGT